MTNDEITGDKKPGLTEANAHWHDVLDIRYRQFLESITALDLDSAQRHLQIFTRLLNAHINFETEYLSRFFAGESNTQKLIDADHLILKRTMDRVAVALGRIESADNARADLINHLNEFMRLLNVLEHHDERERAAFYPQIEEAITSAQSDALGTQMNEIMTASISAP